MCGTALCSENTFENVFWLTGDAVIAVYGFPKSQDISHLLQFEMPYQRKEENLKVLIARCTGTTLKPKTEKHTQNSETGT